MSSTRGNLVLKVIDRTFLVVCGTEAPSDDEWRTYLEAVELHGIDRTMILVHTEGGLPTAPQRRDLDKLLAGHRVPVAVLTDSIRIRWIVTVRSWFDRWICAFPVSGLGDALAYLEIPWSRGELILRELAMLRGSLGLGIER